MSGGSLCTVEGFKFPAGINHKLLFVIITMINTIHDISMPAENCSAMACFQGWLDLDCKY